MDLDRRMLNFMTSEATQTGSGSGSCSKIAGDENDVVVRSEVKIAGDENDVVSPVADRNEVKVGVSAPKNLNSLMENGGGVDNDAVSQFVDRNDVKIDVPANSSLKIGSAVVNDVVPPVVDVNEVKIGVSVPRRLHSLVKTGGGDDHGVVSPVVDTNDVKIGVPGARKLNSTAKTDGVEENDIVLPVVDGNKVKIDVFVPSNVTSAGSNGKKVKFEVPIPKKLLFPLAETSSCADHAQLLVQNYDNFKKSDKPMRFMYYSNGSWMNFEGNVMDVIISGFVSGKPVIEVEMEGLKCLFDFYRMLEIDLVTGNERSISWIDVNGNCFFPKIFVDDLEDIEGSNVNETNPKIEIEIRISDKEANNLDKEELKLGKRKRENSEGGSSNVKEQRVVAAANELHSPKWPKARLLREEEKGYQMVKGLLLSGLKVVDPGVTVISIYQYVRTCPMEQARFEVFQKNMEIVKRVRGNPNVVYAWCGTSAKNVEIILRHGFGMPSVVHGSNAHGVGVYLSPLRLPQISAMMSEVDEYGEKHIILCRVILGKVEKVELGSQQLYPSSVEFDTGVDDLKNPKWYVVWSANMNTHILPECVVSYRSGRHMSGQMNGASSVKGAPHAANALVTLISRLNSLLPPPKVQELQSLYGSYREGKVGKEIFMRQLRSVVGDEMLRSTILEIRG